MRDEFGTRRSEFGHVQWSIEETHPALLLHIVQQRLLDPLQLLSLCALGCSGAAGRGEPSGHPRERPASDVCPPSSSKQPPPPTPRSADPAGAAPLFPQPTPIEPPPVCAPTRTPYAPARSGPCRPRAWSRQATRPSLQRPDRVPISFPAACCCWGIGYGVHGAVQRRGRP